MLLYLSHVNDFFSTPSPSHPSRPSLYDRSRLSRCFANCWSAMGSATFISAPAGDRLRICTRHCGPLSRNLHLRHNLCSKMPRWRIHPLFVQLLSMGGRKSALLLNALL